MAMVSSLKCQNENMPDMEWSEIQNKSRCALRRIQLKVSGIGLDLRILQTIKQSPHD